MNNIVKELKDVGVFYVATIDGDKPRVRPFSSVTEYEGKIYFCTNNTKDVWKQLEKNPYVEISGFKNGEWIRVSGKLVNDDRLEVKKAMLEDPTGPSQIYKYDDEIFKVMYLDEAKCMKYSFTSEPVEIK
jgi:uncharacterized pyridoxamine 5'-phosphate oxidase family protein